MHTARQQGETEQAPRIRGTTLILPTEGNAITPCLKSDGRGISKFFVSLWVEYAYTPYYIHLAIYAYE